MKNNLKIALFLFFGLWIAPSGYAATCTWSGNGANNLWKTVGNWDATCNNNTIPVAGDDLVFPLIAANKSKNLHNNFLPNTSFNSLRITDSGYTLDGVAINLGATGIYASSSPFPNTIKLPINISAQTTIEVHGGWLYMSGVISGNGGLDVVMSGNTACQLRLDVDNTYSGPTRHFGGCLDYSALDIYGYQPQSNITTYTNTALGGYGTVGSITTTGSFSYLLGEAGGAFPSLTMAGNLSLASDSFFAFSAEIQPFKVNGQVNLNQAWLNLYPVSSSNYTPSGLTHTIIQNNGASAVNGTFRENGTFSFRNLPEGAQLVQELGGKRIYFTISYMGGDGNDVVLRNIILAPGATTNSAVVSNGNAQLNGAFRSNGGPTDVSFEWGPTVSYGTTISVGNFFSNADSFENKSANINLAPLPCGTTYHYRIKATNAGNPGGTAYGSDMTFTTPACPADTTPDDFNFTPQTGQALNSTITSNTVTISGINTATPVSITGGSYSINNGPYTTNTGNVNNGNTIKIRLTSSASYNTTTTASLTVGGITRSFNVTTVGGGGRGAPHTPNNGAPNQ